MSKISIEVALLIIKEICKFIGICDDCPMFSMCINNMCEVPEHWKDESIPELGVYIKAQKIDIGLSLLAIKKHCKHTEMCIYCPFTEFCVNNTLTVPRGWKESCIPKIDIEI